MLESLDGALGSEIGAAYPYDDNKVHALCLPAVSNLLAFIHEGVLAVYGRKMLPTHEIVAGTGLRLKDIESCESLADILPILLLGHEGLTSFKIYFQHF